MRLSVVVPTRARGPLLEDCLRALEAQTRRADEVLAVEDPRRRGPAETRNRGLALAAGDVVVFTDDDCLPPPGWLAALERAFEDPRVLCAGGPARPLWEGEPPRRVQGSRRTLSALGLAEEDPGFLIGANFALRRGAGLFAAQDGGCGSDYELSRRLGYSWVPEAWTRHRVGAAKLRTGALLSRLFWQGAARGRLGGRLEPRRGPRQLLGWEGAVSAADALGHLYSRISRRQSASAVRFMKPQAPSIDS